MANVNRRLAKARKRQRLLVFISYRREDPDKIKALLCEKLVRLLPEYEIFQDQHSISPATDYQATIFEAILSAQLVVTLIDDAWHRCWTRDESGAACDDPDDWVFRELQTAIHHNVRVLPVVIHPSREPNRDNLPPSILELAWQQSVIYYPTPDPEGSSLKVADAIQKILTPGESKLRRWTLRGLFLAGTAAAVLLASWFFFADDQRLERERFDKELTALRLNRRELPREHSEKSVVVPVLGLPDYSQFLILGDERIWDLRGFRPLDPKQPPFQSSVEYTRRLRVVKQAEVKEIRFESRTSGAELILECVSHPHRATEYIAEATTLVAGQAMKIRQITIDISDIPVGQEINVILRAAFWDSLQTPEEWWVGAVGYPDSDYVRMLVVFPDDRPFKRYRLETAPNSREQVKPFQGSRSC